MPFIVYKFCPQISSLLVNLFKSYVIRSFVPTQWRIAAETFQSQNLPRPPLSETWGLSH